MSQTHFKKDDRVEVTLPPPRRSLLPRHRAPPPHQRQVPHLRPVPNPNRPPRRSPETLEGDSPPRRRPPHAAQGAPPPLHRVGDDVEAITNKAWRRGTIREIMEDSKYLAVLDDGQADQGFECDHFDLRVHREWDDGSWVPPLPPDQQRTSGVLKCRKIRIKIRDKKETMGNKLTGTVEDVQDDGGIEYEKFDLRLHKEWDDRSSVTPLPEEPELQQKSSRVMKCRKAKKEKARRNFGIGTLVDVSSDEEGYKDAWYTARIVDYIGKDKFVVEYVSLVTEDMTQLLREETLASYIMPCPPPLPPVVQFKVLQKVDAWYNEGWWLGAISKVLTGANYIVYFSTTNEEIEFKHSHLRLHQD